MVSKMTELMRDECDDEVQVKKDSPSKVEGSVWEDSIHHKGQIKE